MPWKAVFGMRNVLSHEYSDIDDEAVFNTIRKDLPVLRETTNKMLEDLESGKLDKFLQD